MISLTRMCSPLSRSLCGPVRPLGHDSLYDAIGKTGDLVPVRKLVVPARIRRIAVPPGDVLHDEAREPPILRIGETACQAHDLVAVPPRGFDKLACDAHSLVAFLYACR